MVDGDAGAGGARPEEDVLADVADLLRAAVAEVGGRPRTGQEAMAREVATALTGSGGHLLIQAGTGTGKSLGYLVPATAWAVRAGRRAVVSTATLALQRQILTRDLPAVARAVSGRLPRAPRIALLKGWHNYACRNKLEGGYPEDTGVLFGLPGDDGGRPGPPEAALGAQVLRLRAWAEETDSGDRDELDPGVSERAWRQVSVTALECLGPTCRFRAECFPQLAREAARGADVVVTNHAMLGVAAAGSPGVLPEHDVLVVDEAHELADRVTAQATVELSPGGVDAAARIARRHGGTPSPALDAAAVALAGALLGLPEGRLVDGLPPALHGAVAGVASGAREVLSALKPSGDEEGAAASKVAQAAVLALFETAERMAEPSGRDVLWIERTEDDRVRLRAAPLTVADLIRDRLLADRRAVLTSATLTIGGLFEPMGRAVGLLAAPGSAGPPSMSPDDGDRTATTTWRGVDVGSPFDYGRQGILYVARHLRPPTRSGIGSDALAELLGLVEAAGGRTLGLFSSRRAAEEAAAAARERLDLPVLCQGEDQLPNLVRAFAAEPRACLFGTLSLWQGVDVPGPTCQLVVIDRIPFPRPDDPVRSARSAALDAVGGNGFLTVSVGHAALLLAQGAGRLIRGLADRGVVAVLDPRLATARYGVILARSLPPFWRTSDAVVVRAALRRLDSQAKTGQNPGK